MERVVIRLHLTAWASVGLCKFVFKQWCSVHHFCFREKRSQLLRTEILGDHFSTLFLCFQFCRCADVRGCCVWFQRWCTTPRTSLPTETVLFLLAFRSNFFVSRHLFYLAATKEERKKGKEGTLSAMPRMFSRVILPPPEGDLIFILAAVYAVKQLISRLAKQFRRLHLICLIKIQLIQLIWGPRAKRP